jgi:hypothetical protein
MKFSEPGQLEGWEWKLRFNRPCVFSTRIWTYCVPSVSATLSGLLRLHRGWRRTSQGYP